MTNRELLEKGIDILKAEKIEDARLDAWYLFSEVFHMNRTQYFMKQSEPACGKPAETFLRYIEKRKKHMPYQYIIGKQTFMGIDFYVNQSVLIPRQDTEILVEEVLKIVKDKMEVLDLCTGSGCILISLMMQGILLKGTASDLSEEALQVAKRNADVYHKKIRFVKSDLFQDIKGSFDIIVSNPPYISTEEIKGLMEEVKAFEPHMALDGKEDGYYYYRNIIEESRSFLKEGGFLFFEIGCNQAEAVIECMERFHFSDVTVKKDLAGLDRVVFGHI